MSRTPSAVSARPVAARRERTFPPRLVGDWKVDALLDEGTFARVYRARPRNCPLDRPADYALKVLRKEYESDPCAVELLRREAVLGRRISHPHLVSVLDASIKTAPFFIVAPNLRGVTLREAAADDEWLPIPHALWIVRQATDGLSALHEHGWLHGDVKPSNVMVAPEGHVTVVDLGMARRLDRPGNVVDRPLTGTPHYIAPELVSSTLRADQRSDIYSLGVTLYWSLTGRLPFTANSLGELVKAHRERAVPDPRRARPQLPRALSHYVLRMLAKQPLRRPQTAQEVIHRLIDFETETFEERFAA